MRTFFDGRPGSTTGLAYNLQQLAGRLRGPVPFSMYPMTTSTQARSAGRTSGARGKKQSSAAPAAPREASLRRRREASADVSAAPAPKTPKSRAKKADAGRKKTDGASGPARGSRRAAAPAPAAAGRRIQVRRSGVHGKGVFAVQPIPAGTRIIEYIGEIIDWDEALRRHPHDPSQPEHTFYFHLDGGQVIDANVGGNAARWINHACEPNCKADETDGRVFIEALVDLQPGQELFYDYGLVIDEKLTKKLKKQYACHCGSPDCRKTMLAPKRQQKAVKFG